MSSSTPFANDLPVDPDCETSLDPSAGTVILSPFLPYTYAIVPYPFDPSNIFNKPMFFMVEHLVWNRPAVVASQTVVVREMSKLREDEDRVKELQNMPEFEVKLEMEVDINDLRMWREKLGWAKAYDATLRTKRYRFYTSLNSCRLLVGYQQKFEWVQITGKWRPAASEADVDFARRDHVCNELERIDELRYKIEDAWNAMNYNTKSNERKIIRKKRRTPDNVIMAMQNAKRQQVELETEVEENEESLACHEIMEDIRASEADARPSNSHLEEQIAGVRRQKPEPHRLNQQPAEAATRRLGSKYEEKEEDGTPLCYRQTSGTPEIADGFGSDEACGLATRMKRQRSNSLNSKTLERTGNVSNPTIFSSDIEDMEIEAIKTAIEPTAAHDAYNVIAPAKFEDDFDTLKHNTQPSARAYSAQSASSKSQGVSINVYCGLFVQLRSIIMKRAERFEILTRVICEQGQIPRHELRFMWKSGLLDLDATPDSLEMGQEEEVYLYRELAGSFQMLALVQQAHYQPWMGGEASTTQRE